MPGYNPYNQQNSMMGINFAYNNSAIQNKGLFNKILRNLSSYGMNYDDMLIRNQIGVNVNEDPMLSKGSNFYDILQQKAISNILNASLKSKLIPP